jgi:glutamate racemase
MSDSRPIGIFDSGIGGLTVVHEVFQRLPGETVVYFGDTARLPYGTKSPEAVRKFALEDILFLMRQEVKLLVAACHTVSSVALDDLNQEFHLPILGVVEPGVRAALEATTTNRIGVIGTRGTVLSRTYETKLNAQREGVHVVTQACPLFVPLAEEGWLDGDVVERITRIYLEPILKEKIDTLILGCTHYPLLKSVIRGVMGPDVTVIDSAEETAKLVEKRLNAVRMANDSRKPAEHKFFVSDIPDQFSEVGQRFLGEELGEVTRVDLESMDLMKGL